MEPSVAIYLNKTFYVKIGTSGKNAAHTKKCVCGQIVTISSLKGFGLKYSTCVFQISLKIERHGNKSNFSFVNQTDWKVGPKRCILL